MYLYKAEQFGLLSGILQRVMSALSDGAFYLVHIRGASVSPRRSVSAYEERIDVEGAEAERGAGSE